MTAFATPTQLLQRYDYRVIGQLITDNGIAEGSSTILSDPITISMLADASGLIVMYALRGGRYSEADLLALTGNGASFLQRLTCDVTIWYFVLRRGLPVEEYPQVVEALKILDALAKGEIIFPVADAINSGVAQSPDIKVQTIINNNQLIDSVAYFPTRRLTLGQLE